MISEIEKLKKNKLKGIYIHIPFCKYICTYCDFCKKHSKDYDHLQYVETLIKEFEYKFQNEKVGTIYIGGGTPSALDKKALVKLLKYLNQKIDFSYVNEFTFECNPDDITEDLMKILSEYNINRISLGIQSLNDRVLRIVNRKYTYNDVLKSLQIIHKYIDNLSVDLMFNLPKQSFADIEKTFDFLKVNKDIIKHISYYSLIIEDHTILGINNHYNFTENEEAKAYKLIQEKLEELGYLQYEISNFAQKGYLSLHNYSYWIGKEYYGLGLGASAYLNGKRETTTKSMKKYIININNENYDKIIVEEEFIDQKEKIKEELIFGLRTNYGINTKIIDITKISKNNLKYLDIGKDRIKIKKEFYFIDNEIIIDLLDNIIYT